MCYVICYYYHDMYTLEDKVCIDCVFKSETKAREYCESNTDIDYWYEEIEFYDD